MPSQMTEQERQEFLAQPHIRVISSASDSDRPPLSVPLWYGYQPGGNISFFTGTQGPQDRAHRESRRAEPDGATRGLRV